MKKASIVNLIIVIGLLLLSVLTLTAVYQTAREESILLFEENFNILDESKWEQKSADCKKDGSQFEYKIADGVDGYADDGILNIKPNLTENQHTSSSQESDITCDSFFYSTKLQTKDKFEANSGRIEVRAKLPGGEWMKSFIGITGDQNDTESEEDPRGFLHILKTAGGESEAGSAELVVFLGSGANQTIIKSSITTDEFHVYEIQWNDNKISFKIDHQKVGEKEFEDMEMNNSTTNGKFRRKRAINQPFHLNIGVNVRGNHSENQVINLEDKRSLSDNRSAAVFQVDYIWLFKTES